MDKKTITCPYCGETIKFGNCHHIKKCMLKYISSLKEEDINNWKKLYLDEGKSLVDMSSIIGLPYSQLQKIFPLIGIHLRNIKEACKNPERKKKYETTMMKNYGTKHNFDKNCASRKKWEQRLLDEEGITNVFQREDVKEKIKKTFNEKYSKEEIYWNYVKGQNLEYLQGKYGKEEGLKRYNEICYNKGRTQKKSYYIETFGEEQGLIKWKERLERIAKGWGRNSGLNKKAYEILDNNNISYEKEFPLGKPDGKCYFYDIKINNLLIELNGIYWHCSPKKYKANDKIIFPNGVEIIAKDKWEYNKEKCDYARAKGYQIIILWEDEFNEENFLKILKENKYGSSSN